MATIVSTPSATTTGSWTANDWWIKDISDPGSGFQIYVTNKDLPMDRPPEAAFFTPLGRDRKIKVADGSKGLEFSLKLEFFSKFECDLFDFYINRHVDMLLQAPWGEQWYVALDGPFTRVYHNFSTTTYLTGDVSFIEVDKP